MVGRARALRGVHLIGRRAFGVFASAAILCIAASSVLGAPETADPNITGNWKIDGRLAGHGIHLICHFDQGNVSLSGLCFGDGTPTTAARITDGRAIWQWKTSGHTLTFDAGFQPDGTLKGVIRTAAFMGISVSGAFTAERPPEASATAEPPRGLSALREILGDLAQGRLTTSSCTEELAEGLRKQIGVLQSVYQPLGRINSLSFIDRVGEPKDSLATEIYEVHFAEADRLCSIDVTSQSKISQLVCRSE